MQRQSAGSAVFGVVRFFRAKYFFSFTTLLSVFVLARAPLLRAASAPTIIGISPTNVVEGSTVALHAMISAPDSAGPFTYFWSFEDATSSTNESPPRTFSYYHENVSVTVVDENGVSSLPFNQLVEIIDEPPSILGISPSEGKQGDLLTFTAQIDHPRSQTIQKIEWTLPDGSKSSLPNPTYLFLKPGDYPVTAKVDNFAFEFVYRNEETFDPSPEFYPGAVEFGDEIVLGGTNRFLQHLELLYYGDFKDLTDDERQGVSANVRIYRNDGEQLSQYYTMPGTVLWESGSFRLNQGYTWKLFQDINTEVPDSLTWTIEFAGLPQTPGKRAGIVFAHSNTHSAEDAGFSYDDYWQKSGDIWLPYDFNQHPIANFGTTASVLSSEIAESSDVFTNLVHIENLPPSIASFNVPATALLQASVSFSAVATDPGNDSVTLEWDFGDGNKSIGQPVSNIFSGEGSYTISLKATDEFGASVSTSAVLNITADHEALLFSSLPPIDSAEGTAYTYNIQTIQPGAGQVLSITALKLPKWLTMVDQGDGTGSLSGVPRNDDVGANEVSLELSDGQSSARQDFTIIVANVDDPPTISTISDRSILVGSGISTVSFSVGDIDSPLEVLQITATSSNEDVVHSSDLVITGSGSGRSLAFSPAGTGGKAQVTITVSDGTLSVEDSFQVSVNELPFFQIVTNSSAGGQVQLDPQSSDSRYAGGSTVEVTAVPDAGFAFAGWSSGVPGSNNPVSIIVSSNTVVAANFKDAVAPLITIISPLPGPSENQVVQFAGTIEDNVSVASAQWYRAGVLIGNLPLTNSHFLVDGIRLNRASNQFKIVVEDGAGNVAETAIQVYWAPGLVLSVGDAPVQTEGHTIQVPVLLNSAGQVGGMHFILHYNPDFLGEPVFTWSSAISLSQNSVDTSTPGLVKATFSFPGATVAAGVQTIGTLEMRARSVPFALTTEVEPEVIDISTALGDPIHDGIDAYLGLLKISPRAFTGDINGNGRLDVGDAALLQRLILGLDVPRSWDLGLNDLNGNNALDSGDVTRLLRTVVGLSPQPGALALEEGSGSDGILAAKTRAKTLVQSQAQLLPESITGKAGDVVTVQVKLANLPNPITSAFFRLRYPVSAFQLVSAQSYAAGSMVPPDAVKIWNSLPDEGVLSFAASSANTWTNQNGILAEISFKINAGIPDQTSFLINLEQLEISEDGFESPSIRLIDSSYLSGIAFPPPRLNNLKLLTDDSVELNVSSEINQNLLVEYSDDLNRWTPLATLPSGSGAFQIGGGTTGHTRGFYRLKAFVPLNAPTEIDPVTKR